MLSLRSLLGTAGSPEAMSDDRAGMFELFSFAWGISQLLHQTVFYDDWSHLGFRYAPGWLLTIAALLLTLKPSSPYRLASVAVMDVLWRLEQVPQVPNHIFFNMVVNLTIAVAIGKPVLRHALRRLRAGAIEEQVDRAAILDRFAAPVRLQLILLYMFTALAKLNVDFMNLQVSCGAVMFRETVEGIGASVHSDWLPAVSIWTTILMESLAPVLLAMPKTRSAGVVMGSVFHLLLSFHPLPAIFSFSSMCMSLYVLFLPPYFAKLLKGRWVRYRDRWLVLDQQGSRIRVAVVPAALTIAGLGLVWTRHFESATPLNSFTLVKQVVFGLWLIWGIALLTAFYTFALAYHPLQLRPEIAGSRKSSIAAWCLPLLVVFTGLNPYLGLRTETAFAMFTNLRTEGGRTNHLFIPVRWHLAGWQEDLVQILDSSEAEFRAVRDKGELIPFFLFRSRTSETNGHFWVLYRRNDTEHYFDSLDEPNHELLRRPSLVQRMWFAFRTIDRDGPMRCRH